MWPFAHLLALTHGLAAALVSIAAFYLIGVLAASATLAELASVAR